MKTLNFPKVNLWNTNNSHKIMFVNEEGFRKEKLLKQIGIDYHSLADSFGIVDYPELKRRNELVNFLLKNPLFRKYLKDASIDFHIPIDGESFLSFYFARRKNEVMPFYTELSEFQKQLNNTKAHSEETTKIKDFLNGSFEIMKKEEFEKANEIKSLVDKATFLEGEISVQWSSSHSQVQVIGKNVFGYKKHYYGAGKDLLRKIPKWTKKNFFRSIFLGPIWKNVIESINQKRMKKFYSDYIVDSLPSDIAKDVGVHFNNLFFGEEGLKQILKKNELKEISFNYFFRYKGKGLYLKLIDLYTYTPFVSSAEKSLINFEGDQLNFLGYSKETKKRINNLNSEFSARLGRRYADLKTFLLRNIVLEECSEIVSELNIPSPLTDKGYKWYGLEELYNSSYAKEVFDKVRKYRSFISRNLSTLQDVSSLVDIFERKAKEWKLSISVPSILEPSKHLLSFDKLYPIQIIGDSTTANKNIKVKDLKPIHSLEKINGQLIGLTGQNAGGKSVTHETIINALYLAQSGLPVFGQNFSCNPKNLIGMLFLERGEGSTMQLQIQKMVNIFKALKKYKGNSVFLVLDEIGTGTDHLEAVAYGTALLGKISQKKISCIYTTQFSDIAISAENDFGAKNYQLDTKHNIRPGVGKANLEYVINKEGLSKYLS